MTHVGMGLVIVAAGLAADGPGGSKVRPEYEALVKAYEKDLKAWQAKYLPVGGDVDNVARLRDWPAWGYIPRVLALAEAHPDDPAAVDALLWVVRLRDRVGVQDREIYPHYERAVALLRGHLADPRIDRDVFVILGLAPTPGTEDFLRLVLERGRDLDARGCACLALADCLANRREIALENWFDRPKDAFQRAVAERLDPGFLLHIRTADVAALSGEAAALYGRADREFGDVVARRRGILPEFVGVRAKARLRELLTLTVGRVAPEIEGADASGRRLSLREHRGKVVVVAVSHAGSAELHKQLRDLLAKHEGEPFAVLGVSVDLRKADLDASIRAGDVTWPSWWDGLNGPIVSAWRGSDAPPLFVLDAQGVIRAREHRGEDLGEPVNRLLAELKGKP